MKLLQSLALAALFLSGAAMAAHCPADMKRIDKALAEGPELSAEQLEKVKSLRAEGERLHKAGDHAASVSRLNAALDILDV